MEYIINKAMPITISALFFDTNREPKIANGIADIPKKMTSSRRLDADADPTVKYTKSPGATNAVGRISDPAALDAK